MSAVEVEMGLARRVDGMALRDVPVYVSGGYPEKKFAGEFASALEKKFRVHITFPWWSQEDDQFAYNLQARSELEAIRFSELLFVLDRGARTGTSFEMGYFLGLNRGKTCYWLTDEKQNDVLGWFGSALSGEHTDLTKNMPQVVNVVCPKWDIESLMYRMGDFAIR